MRHTRRISVIAALCVMTVSLSGCAYCNNKSWSDMTAEEKTEVRQNFEETAQESKEEFSGSAAEEKFVSFIIDSVGHALDDAD